MTLSPDIAHLDIMSDFTYRNLGAVQKKGIVYVSRSRFKNGRLAGESYLELHLRKCGVEIVYPELIPLNEQLRIYYSAQLLIFSEGSALHSLQLLGACLGDVAVIMRRPGATMFKTFVEARSQSYIEVNYIKSMLISYNSTGTLLDASGLTLPDESKLLAWLSETGISISGWSSIDFRNDVTKDIRSWLVLEHKRPAHHYLTKPAILKCLKESGFGEIANEVEREFPVVSEYSDSSIAIYKNALAAEAEGNLESAISKIDDAILLAPNFNDLHIKKCQLLDQLGRPEEAWVALENYKGIFGSNTNLIYYLAQLAHKIGKTSEALEAVERAIQIDPSDPAFYSLKSLILDGSGKINEAVEAAAAMVDLQKDNYRSLAHYANLLGKAGFHKKAIGIIDEAIALAPQDAHLYHRKSMLLQKDGQSLYAKDIIKHAISLIPEHQGFRTHLLNILISLSDFKAALTEIKIAISHDPFDVIFYKTAIRVSEELGNKEDALNFALQACSIATNDAQIRVRAANLASELGRPEDAIMILREALNITPNDSGILGRLSVISDKIGKTEDALNFAKKAIERNPLNAHAFAHLSNIFVRQGDLNSAQDAIDKSIAINSLEPGFYCQKSNLFLRQGNLQKAESILISALKSLPEAARIHVQLSKLYLMKHDYMNALRHADTALQLGDTDIETIELKRATTEKLNRSLAGR